MYPNFLGAEAPAVLTPEEAAQQRIYRQVLEQRAWALEQAAPHSRAKYRAWSIGTSLLVIGAPGAGTYYFDRNQRWCGRGW